MEKKADFRNVILIMTSNAGAREMSTQSIGFREAGRRCFGQGEKGHRSAFQPGIQEPA